MTSLQRSNHLVRLVVALTIAASAPWNGLRAQPDWSFGRVSVRDGLSSDAVTALWQDEQGFMWIGTVDGLSRFDGHEAVESTEILESALNDGFVNPGAMVGGDGLLWVGTRGGLHRIELATGRMEVYVHDEGDTLSLSDDFVTSLAISPGEELWIGTNGGLNRLIAGEKRFQRYLVGSEPGGLTHAAVTSLAFDAQGGLWIGTRHGLNRMALPEEQIQHIRDAFIDVHITALAYEPQPGVLWVGTMDKGLYAYRPNSTAPPHRVTSPKQDPYQEWVTGIALDEDGGVWATTWGGGICRATAASDVATCTRRSFDDPSSLASDFTTSLLFDAGGTLWVGTWEGVSIRRGGGVFRHYSYDGTSSNSSLTNPRVLSIASTGDTLWVGTQGGGLHRLDPASGLVIPVSLGEPRGRASVWSLSTDSSGGVWAATRDLGVRRYDPRTARVDAFMHNPEGPHSLSSNLTYTVFHDRGGILWVGTVTEGLNRYDPERGFVRYQHDPTDPTSLSHDSVWPIVEDRSGTLWVGTVGGGLNRYDPASDSFSAYRHDAQDSTSLGSDRVLSLAETDAGILWIGTLGDGLNRYDPASDSFSRFGMEQGLAHRNAVCVLPSEGEDVWVGTSNGLSVFDARQERLYTYREQQGLPTATFLPAACHRTADGMLYFGTSNGVVAFHPRDLPRPTYRPRAVLTAIEVMGEPLRTDTLPSQLRHLQLRHDENFLEFTFAALDPSAPGRYTYRYRLDGVDRGWRDVGPRRYATYGDLSPGFYTFQLQAAAAGQPWSATPERVLYVRIVPALWQTWWFRGAGFLLLLSLTLGAYWYYSHHRRREERARHALSIELHDNVLSKMAMLAMDLEVIGRRPSLEEGTSRTTLLRGAGHVRSLMQELRDLSRRVRDVHRTTSSLVEEMRRSARQLLADRDLVFREQSADTRIFESVAAHTLAIYREVLHNVVRHSEAERVEIYVRTEGRDFLFTVRDDGVGFEATVESHGRGLQNMHHRSTRVRGCLEVRSTPGGGAEVAFRVKIT
jgi:ligand-binding sensor domain-containing protein/signal transduction histidine kinase